MSASRSDAAPAKDESAALPPALGSRPVLDPLDHVDKVGLTTPPGRSWATPAASGRGSRSSSGGSDEVRQLRPPTKLDADQAAGSAAEPDCARPSLATAARAAG